MIYGLNFNNTQIPVIRPRRDLFASRLGKGFRPVGDNTTATWILSGVCNTKDELDQMLIQANNGYRRFHVVSRKAGKVDWIGVYCG